MHSPRLAYPGLAGQWLKEEFDTRCGIQVIYEGQKSASGYFGRGKDQFNDWEGRGHNQFVPVLGGNGTEIAPTGNIFEEPPGQMR